MTFLKKYITHKHCALFSIYDHSIFEAMSIVCQQLLENILSPFENILNAFVSSNKMEKAFIFDLHPKVLFKLMNEIFRVLN